MKWKIYDIKVIATWNVHFLLAFHNSLRVRLLNQCLCDDGLCQQSCNILIEKCAFCDITLERLSLQLLLQLTFDGVSFVVVVSIASWAANISVWFSGKLLHNIGCVIYSQRVRAETQLILEIFFAFRNIQTLPSSTSGSKNSHNCDYALPCLINIE